MGRLFADGASAEAEIARVTALELLERVPPTLDHVRVLNIVAYPPLFASRYADVAAAELRALAIAEELGAPPEAAVARVPLGIALSFLGRLEEGESHIQTALETARRLDQPEALADAYLALGIVREAAGAFDEAVAVMAQGVAVLTDRRVERTHATTLHNNMAEALRRLGRWDEALEILERELAHEGTGWEVGQGNVLKGHLLAARGQHDESTVALEQAWREFGPSGTGFIGHYRAAHAENALWTGDPARALDLAAGAVAEIAPTLDLRWIGELVVLGTRAAADLAAAPGADRIAAGRRADELLAALEAAVDEAARTGTIFEREADGYRATATAERARVDGAPVSAAWRAAAATWDRLGQPYPAAYARFRAGEAALLGGEAREPATVDLREAARVARELRATPLLSAVEDLARRARLALAHDAPPRAAAHPPGGSNQHGLTQRELEVAALLGEGRSDQEIADALFISAKTASVHVSNIKAKLGVERRLEASIIAARLGSEGE
jgi:DNA-binding CsgD family transcriptional regulator/tetratricopeptide (TPR) repeat protein